MSEKVWGHVAGEGEFENRGQEHQGRPKRAPQKFKKLFFSAIAHHFSVRRREGKGVGVTLEVRLHGLMVKGRRWR